MATWSPLLVERRVTLLTGEVLLLILLRNLKNERGCPKPLRMMLLVPWYKRT